MTTIDLDIELDEGSFTSEPAVAPHQRAAATCTRPSHEIRPSWCTGTADLAATWEVHR